MTYTNAGELVREFVAALGVSVESVEQVPCAAHELWNVRTPDSKRLIGPQGEHLRALNLLVRKYAERVEGLREAKFLVDVNSYQHSRIAELEQKARLLADRVRTFRSSAEMTPMNAYERMIVHALFANDPEVTSESDGEGPLRHVVLRYRAETAGL